MKLHILYILLIYAAANLSFALGKDNLPPLNRFPRMVQEYFVTQVRHIEDEANRRRSALKTKTDAEGYVAEVRGKIRQCFGDFPEKTPLNARVTGTTEHDAYRVENIVFESRPHFLVTANLYIPKGKTHPMPGVVGACGHSSNGKAAGAYQSFARGLARQGYVVLLYDPIGQGERLQYLDNNGKPAVGYGVAEHLLAGNQQFLVGEFFGAWRAWDGMRALDYLLSGPEVDPGRIGVTGNSGGGTMTTWLSGLERRWTMSAPGCFVTTLRRNIENEEAQDTEQCPPRMLALGLDHSDFLAAMAPKPVILLAKERDFFDVRGTEEAYGRLRHLYGLLGAPEKVSLFIGPSYHGYSKENREAMYRWFGQWSQVPAPEAEPALHIDDDSALQATPKGSVTLAGSRTVQSFTAEKARRLAKSRPKNLDAARLQSLVRKTLRLPEHLPESPPDYRILRARSSRGYPKNHWLTYAVESEPGIFAVVYALSDERLYSRPPKTTAPAYLYISDLSSDRELREEPLIRELISKHPDARFYTCDVRGSGESQPDTCRPGSFLDPYGCDYFYAITSIMLDKPYVGQKTYDILRVVQWLKSIGHENIHLVAKGRGSVPATFAAVLSDDIDEATLKNPLRSYACIAMAERYSWPLSCFVPNVLEYYDLPDCYRILAQKRLKQIAPLGANDLAR